MNTDKKLPELDPETQALFDKLEREDREMIAAAQPRDAVEEYMVDQYRRMLRLMKGNDTAQLKQQEAYVDDQLDSLKMLRREKKLDYQFARTYLETQRARIKGLLGPDAAPPKDNDKPGTGAVESDQRLAA